MTNLDIIKRLYNDYTKRFVSKIALSVFFSLLVAGSTSAIAWLLDPAIKKIFVDKNQDLILIIPLAIVLAFSTKGISLYMARTTLIRVGQDVVVVDNYLPVEIARLQLVQGDVFRAEILAISHAILILTLAARSRNRDFISSQ